MKTIAIAASIALLSFVPVASASADVCALPPVSQWDVCVEDGCVIVEGPAIRREVCPGHLIAGPGCEEGELGACVYRDPNGDTCVRIQIGYHHIEECVSPRVV